MKIDEDAIRKLADILNETDLTEIEISEGDQSVRVSRGGGTAIVGAAPVTATPAAQMESDPTVNGPANLDAPSNITQDHPGAVISPMVGTVYMQAEPGTPSFVSVGANVNEGDTLLIVEAMKVMNPVKAHKSGTVQKILIEDGQPIEYGDVLMLIE